jgi:hypothetical protein
MARIKVIDNATGRIGTVSEEFLLQDSNKYTRVGGGAQEPTSLAQKVGTGIVGLPASLAKPFVNTVERVGGAGESLLRMWLTNAAQKAAKEGDLDRSIKLGTIAGADSKLTQDEEYKNKLTDPLQMAKDSAAMLSWGVPIKAASPFISGAKAGAMGGFGYSSETTPEGLLGSTAMGTVTGGVSAKLLNKFFGGKAAKTSKEMAEEIASKPNLPEKIGLDMKRMAGKYSVKGPMGIVKENEQILWANSHGLDVGDANNMRYGVADVYSKNKDIVGVGLKNSTETYSANQLKNRIIDEVKKESFFYDGSKAANDTLKNLASTIVQNNKGGRMTAEQVFEATMNIQSQLQKAYEATAGQAGTSISLKAGLGMDAADTLHTVLNNMTDDALKPALKEMSMAHTVAKNLLKASQDNANLFGVGVIGPAQGLQTVENAIGNVGLKVGSFIRGGQAGTAATKPVLETFAGSKTPAALSAFMQGQPSQGIPQTETPFAAPETEGIITKTQYQKMLMDDLQATGGKNGDAIQKAYERLGGGGEAEKKTETQLARDSALNLSKQAYGLLKSGKIKTGMVGGPVESLKGNFGLADQTTLTYQTLIGSLKATIAKARAGTSFTPNEEALLNEYVPIKGDSYQRAMTKLLLLQNPDAIARAQAEFESIRGR